MMFTLKVITEDLSTKVFSLIVAVILFLFVNIEESTPVAVDFLLDYELPKGLMLAPGAPTTLHTTLQGPWAAFRMRSSTTLDPIVIKLSKSGPGSIRYNVQDRDVQLPAGVRLLSFYPSELNLTLTQRLSSTPPDLSLPTTPPR